MKRVARDCDRRRPAAIAMLETRAEHGRAVVIVFAFAAEENQVNVAVPQFVKTGRMFVVAGFDFWPEDAFDVNLVTREQVTDDSSSQEQANKIISKRSTEVSGTVHALHH